MRRCVQSFDWLCRCWFVTPLLVAVGVHGDGGWRCDWEKLQGPSAAMGHSRTREVTPDVTFTMQPIVSLICCTLKWTMNSNRTRQLLHSTVCIFNLVGNKKIKKTFSTQPCKCVIEYPEHLIHPACVFKWWSVCYFLQRNRTQQEQSHWNSLFSHKLCCNRRKVCFFYHLVVSN